MARFKVISVFFISSLLLLQCGRDRVGGGNPPVVPPAPTPSGDPGTLKKVQVFLFAAGYCGPCKVELPEVRDWYKGLSQKRKEQAQIRVYVTAGETPTEKPTQEYADSFGKRFDLPFEMKPDKFSTECRKYYSGSCSVPATVVFNAQGKVSDIFSGPVSPSQLEQAIEKAAQ